MLKSLALSALADGEGGNEVAWKINITAGRRGGGSRRDERHGRNGEASTRQH